MGLFEITQLNSELTAWLVIDEQEYEMSQFSISFGQSIDYKGQPQDETRGGRMLVGLTQILPENLYQWAMMSMPKNGKIEFRLKNVNTPFRVEFMNAYCVDFNRVISANGGVDTILKISPDELLVNEISFDNHWIK